MYRLARLNVTLIHYLYGNIQLKRTVIISENCVQKWLLSLVNDKVSHDDCVSFEKQSFDFLIRLLFSMIILSFCCAHNTNDHDSHVATLIDQIYWRSTNKTSANFYYFSKDNRQMRFLQEYLNENKNRNYEFATNVLSIWTHNMHGNNVLYVIYTNFGMFRNCFSCFCGLVTHNSRKYYMWMLFWKVFH